MTAETVTTEPIVFTTLAMLLVALPSTCGDEMVATLVASPGATALAVMVMPAPRPVAKLPRLHVTIPPACEQLPVVIVAETKLTPGGNEFVTMTLVAVNSPRFVTVSEYVSVPPKATGSGAEDSVNSNSVLGTTFVTNASKEPADVLWKAPVVVWRFVDDVS